jgi:hypothetical protein
MKASERYFEYAITFVTALLCGGAVALIVVLASGCGALSGADVGKVTTTGVKIAACIEEALTDQQIFEIKQKIARIENDRQAKRDLREVIDEHPDSTVNVEVEKVLKDGAPK